MTESQPALEMAYQGHSLHEVSIASGDSLKRRLSSVDVDVLELLDIFWKTSPDWNSRANVFVGLMFSAAGCHTLHFEDLNLDSSNLPSAKEANNVEMEPEALNPSFTARYSKFISQLFKMIPLDEAGILFLRNLVKIVIRMIVNPWDSVRVMGACTGLKLLTFCSKISNSASLESHDTSCDTNSPPNTSYVKKQFTSLKKNLEIGIFKKAVRDLCVSVRTLAFAEILVWAWHDPRNLLDGELPNSLQFGLHDKRECAVYALTALELLFKEDLQDSRQKALFVKIQDALVCHLGSDGQFAVKAMSTLASAVRYVKKTPSCRDVILLSVLNKYQAVAVDAAKYLFEVFDMEKDLSNPLMVLKRLLIFHLEAVWNMKANIAAEDLLMDAFHPILKDFVLWEHWEQLLFSCEAEHTVVVAKMFYSYARKVTTSYCPPGRVRCGDSPKKKDLLSAANDFTKFLARTWENFFSMDKIRLNPEAMSVITRMMTLFNASLLSNIAFDIIKYLSQIVKESSNEPLLSAAWSTISHLYKVIPWDSASAMHLKSIFESAKNCVVEEFSEILHHSSLMIGSGSEESKTRLLFAIKFVEPHDNFSSLWEKCTEELDSQCANTNMDVAKVGKILQVLHRILIRQFDAITALSSSADCSGGTVDDQVAPGDSQLSLSADLTSQLLFRGQYLQKQAVHFLQNSEPLKQLSFDILVDMVVCFGKHTAGHPTCIIISDTLHSEIEPQLVKAACSAARQTNCEDDSACCHVLKYVCELFSEGMIDITKIDVLLTVTGVNEGHDVNIMSSLKSYADRYPGKYMLVAAAIVSGLIGIISEDFSFAAEAAEIDHVWQTAAEKMRERYAYWETIVNFIAVLKNRKIRNAAIGLMRDFAIHTGNDYLISKTSELFTASTTVHADAESAAGDSEAAPESDFSLAFAERSLIPHSTPHPSAALAEISETEPSED